MCQGRLTLVITNNRFPARAVRPWNKLLRVEAPSLKVLRHLGVCFRGYCGGAGGSG